MHFYLDKKIILLLHNNYCSIVDINTFTVCDTWRQKIAMLIRMQFLNDIDKSRHGFKTAQKFHKF